MKGSKFIQLFSVLACAVALLFGSVAPALAATGDTSTGSITVSSDAHSQSKLYRIIDVENWTEGTTSAPKFVWNTDVATWLKNQDAYKGYVNADGSVSDSFSEKLDDATAKGFYEALSAAIAANPSSFANLQAAATLDFGQYATPKKAENLPMGNYLIVTNSTATGKENIRIFEPTAVNIVPTKQADGSYAFTDNAATPNVTLKSTKPTISKTQDTTDLTVGGMVGKTVKFTLIADVPSYAEGYTNKTFTIDDTMSKGLAYTDGSAKFYTVANGQPTTTKLNAGALTAGTAAKQADGSTKISFTGDWNKLSTYAGQKVAVVYEATITSDAVVHSALTNEATLNYGNGFTTNSEQTKLYTYGISVLKYTTKDGKQEALKGAKFELQYTDVQNNTQKVSFTGSKGAYTAAATGATGTVTEIEVGDDGKLLLSNLAEGTYQLVETAAPAGFQKLQQPIPVTIAKNGDTGDVAGQDTAHAGYVYQTVENKEGFSLPTTGGTGTLLLTAAGVVLLGGSLGLVLKLRKQV